MFRLLSFFSTTSFTYNLSNYLLVPIYQFPWVTTSIMRTVTLYSNRKLITRACMRCKGRAVGFSAILPVYRTSVWFSSVHMRSWDSSKLPGCRSELCFSNSLIIHKAKTKEIHNWSVFRNRRKITAEFCQLSPGFSPEILVRLRSNFKHSFSVLPPISKYLETR